MPVYFHQALVCDPLGRMASHHPGVWPLTTRAYGITPPGRMASHHSGVWHRAIRAYGIDPPGWVRPTHPSGWRRHTNACVCGGLTHGSPVKPCVCRLSRIYNRHMILQVIRYYL
jgi:hypothetical protein